MERQERGGIFYGMLWLGGLTPPKVLEREQVSELDFYWVILRCLPLQRCPGNGFRIFRDDDSA